VWEDFWPHLNIIIDFIYTRSYFERVFLPLRRNAQPIELGIFPLCFSAQKMEVLRQDVEEIEKEMEELRAYLAKTDEKREEAETTIEDGMDYQDEGKIKEARPARRWCFHLIAFPCFEFRGFSTVMLV